MNRKYGAATGQGRRFWPIQEPGRKSSSRGLPPNAANSCFASPRAPLNFALAASFNPILLAITRRCLASAYLSMQRQRIYRADGRCPPKKAIKIIGTGSRMLQRISDRSRSVTANFAHVPPHSKGQASELVGCPSGKVTFLERGWGTAAILGIGRRGPSYGREQLYRAVRLRQSPEEPLGYRAGRSNLVTTRRSNDIEPLLLVF